MKIRFNKFNYLNLTIILVTSLIALIGTVILYSAAEGNIYPWAYKQFLRFIFGLFLTIIISNIDIRTWNSLAYVFYISSFVSLIAVEALGFIGMGAKRWIDLYVFNFQPSEIMKISLILSISKYFHNLTIKEIKNFKFLIIPTLMILLPSFFIVKQPDLGTAILLILICGSIFFVSGVKFSFFIFIIISFGLLVPLLWPLLKDYQKNRIISFLNPEEEPLNLGYHILQSKIALGSGGFLGKGFLKGTQSHLDFLPEKQTDFIFTMLCEEFGFFGGIIIIILYSILITYGFKVSIKSRNSFGKYVALGITSMIFYHVFINISMVLGLLPVVGVPLPLLSYGGTSMLTLMIGIGLILSVSIHYDIRIGK